MDFFHCIPYRHLLISISLSLHTAQFWSFIMCECKKSWEALLQETSAQDLFFYKSHCLWGTTSLWVNQGSWDLIIAQLLKKSYYTSHSSNKFLILFKLAIFSLYSLDSTYWYITPVLAHCDLHIVYDEQIKHKMFIKWYWTTDFCQSTKATQWKKNSLFNKYCWNNWLSIGNKYEPKCLIP